MNHQRATESEFERQLGDELEAIVARRGPSQVGAMPTTPKPVWRRTRAQLAVAVAAAGCATVALLIGAGGGDTATAYAVEAQPEGLVSVEISNLEDAKGLEQALEEVGIPASVSYLPAGTTCKEPRFRPVPGQDGVQGMTQATTVPSGGAAGPPFAVTGPLVYTISRDAVGPGQTLVITASASPGGLFAHNRVEIAEGAVAPCEPIPAPAAPNSVVPFGQGKTR